MSNSHLTQYIIIGIIAAIAIASIVRYIIKIRRCNSPEDVCQCCSAKSLCGKAKKSGTGIANVKK